VIELQYGQAVMAAIVEVQAVELVRADPLRDVAVGRADYDIDLVSQTVQLAGQVVKVNALSAAVFITSIAKETYLQIEPPKKRCPSGTGRTWGFGGVPQINPPPRVGDKGVDLQLIKASHIHYPLGLTV
jgi:hypothetical protein